MASVLHHLLKKAPAEALRDMNGPNRTLTDLPTELLTRILLFAPYESVSISCVCKRLRQLTLSIPQCWTHVSNYQTPSELEIYLTRGKKEKLVVALFSKTGDNAECTQFMRTVFPHSKRWKEFRFEADEYRQEFYSQLHKVHQVKNGRRTFPALETLHLQCYHPNYKLDVQADVGDWRVDLNFWGRWIMPNLRKVYISSVPHSFYGTPAALYGKELTFLRLDYHKDTSRHDDFPNWTRFLSGFQFLRVLELTFYKMKPENKHQLEPQTLPNLEYLRLDFTPKAFGHPIQAGIVFEEMMEYLITPQLSHLVVHTDTKKRLSILSWLRGIKYDKLSTLHRIYFQVRDPSFGIVFQLPHTRSSSSDLYSSFPGLDEHEDQSLLTLPKLELEKLPEGPRLASRELNFVDLLRDDKNALEYMEKFGWFRNEGRGSAQDSCDTDPVYD